MNKSALMYYSFFASSSAFAGGLISAVKLLKTMLKLLTLALGAYLGVTWGASYNQYLLSTNDTAMYAMLGVVTTAGLLIALTPVKRIGARLAN